MSYDFLPIQCGKYKDCCPPQKVPESPRPAKKVSEVVRDPHQIELKLLIEKFESMVKKIDQIVSLLENNAAGSDDQSLFSAPHPVIHNWKRIHSSSSSFFHSGS